MERKKLFNLFFGFMVILFVSVSVFSMDKVYKTELYAFEVKYNGSFIIDNYYILDGFTQEDHFDYFFIIKTLDKYGSEIDNYKFSKPYIMNVIGPGNKPMPNPDYIMETYLLPYDEDAVFVEIVDKLGLSYYKVKIDDIGKNLDDFQNNQNQSSNDDNNNNDSGDEDDNNVDDVDNKINVKIPDIEKIKAEQEVQDDGGNLIFTIVGVLFVLIALVLIGYAIVKKNS